MMKLGRLDALYKNLAEFEFVSPHTPKMWRFAESLVTTQKNQQTAVGVAGAAVNK